MAFLLLLLSWFLVVLAELIHKTRVFFSHAVAKFVGKFQAVSTLSVSSVISSFAVTLSVIVNGEVFVPFVLGHSCTLV